MVWFTNQNSNPLEIEDSATDVLKTTSRKSNSKTAEVIGDLTGKKTTDKITKAFRTSPQSTLVINE